jgi:conjugal transfer pilin signal peptidase TrbI
MDYGTSGGESLHPAGSTHVSAHPDGFDSRYGEIGFACAKQIIGTGTPIL